MKKYLLMMSVLITLILTSCSGTDYLSVIPQGSQAIISFDLAGMAKSANLDASKSNALKSLLHIDNPSECGIDITSKVYLFESPDGSLGLVAKVNDDDDMENYFNKLSGSGICKKVTKNRGFEWTVLKDSWVIGFSSKAMLVMGPTVGSAQEELKRTMAKYLDANEDDGIKGTPLFDKLDSMTGDVNMVASVVALPQKIGTPFRLGAPADSDPADVMIAATMQTSNNCLTITGSTFSFNTTVNRALQSSAASYRPITGQFIPSLSDSDAATVVLNFDGSNYIKVLRSDKGLRAALVGLNAAVDADNMIKSIDGDATIVIKSMKGDKMDYSFAAKVKSDAFLDDVGYWKKSLPSGATLTDFGKDCYHLSTGEWNIFFGVRSKSVLYMGSSSKIASLSGMPSSKQLPTSVTNNIKGKKQCIIINLDAIAETQPAITTVKELLKPIFGDFKYIIYSVK